MNSNRYPATCYRCGGKVAPGGGTTEFVQWPGSRWPQLRGTRNMTLVQHHGCAITYKGTLTHYYYAPDGDK